MRNAQEKVTSFGAELRVTLWLILVDSLLLDRKWMAFGLVVIAKQGGLLSVVCRFRGICFLLNCSYGPWMALARTLPNFARAT